jgi:hypothetical protein
VPVAAVVPYWLWAAFWKRRRELRWDHVALAVGMTGLAWGNKGSKRLFIAILPLSFVALLYDGMRCIRTLGMAPEDVHVADLRALEMRLFGIGSGSSRMTVQDWCQQRRPSTLLDLYCAVPYGIFIFVEVGYAFYLFWRHPRAQRRFAWAFFVMNLAGFATYRLYPAAPPWYFHQFGCEVDLDTPSNPGPSLKRVDAMLGFPYFDGLYGRGSDVFGAVPSLHVAYPMLMLWEGWPLHGALARSLLVWFYGSMSFAAVYLDHHWIVDIVLGTAYAVGASELTHAVLPEPGKLKSRRRSRRFPRSPVPKWLR